MFLENFCSKSDAQVEFSRQQASDFAKKIANDFNPIHDIDSKRFCVPGDLLFSYILMNEGLSENMHCVFGGMVSDGVPLDLSNTAEDHLSFSDAKGKEYLHVERSGERNNDQAMIEQLIRSYVAFSGDNFPHILVPLMKEKNVMINPARPLVIYESMSLHMDSLDIKQAQVEMSASKLEVEGKRGNVELQFAIKDGDKIVGRGVKTMIMSSLREYQQDQIDNMIEQYAIYKATKS